MIKIFDKIATFFRSAAWYTHFCGSLILTIPKLKRLEKRMGTMTDIEFAELAYKTVRKWAESQIKWTGAKIDFAGLENIPNEPVVFIANHQSYYDIGMFLALIEKPKGFVAKVEMTKAPVMSKWMEYIGCIFLDRSNIKKSAKAINDGIAKIKSGHSLVIFPEGTRSKSNKMNEWKAGSFKLATKSNATIVPVTFYDSFTVFEANNYWVKPGNLKMVIHKPIKTDGMTREEAAELPQKVYDIINNELISLSKEQNN